MSSRLGEGGGGDVGVGVGVGGVIDSGEGNQVGTTAKRYESAA